MPRMVEKIDAQTEMINEFFAAWCSAGSCIKELNHLVVKPDNGKAIMAALLKAKIGSKMIGAYRKIK